ncbi:MAG: DNA methyltransferase [Aestuariivita sp.]|nr:DNA methyltransferase [Aestuariivita sp.]MCY4288993.1 DNA methyltransferase [Aestuariivita sp.]MCY4346582.1 DNA methyltransferase [Aestuariivita sp.]
MGTLSRPAGSGSSGAEKPVANGKMNTLLPEDLAAHGWYRFVLSFPPHLVREFVTRFGLSGDNLLLDPFCGTGTTLVEAKKLGIPSVGLETVAVSRLAANTKTNWSINPDRFAAHAHRVASATLRLFEEQGVTDVPMASIPPERKLRSLPPEVERLMLKNSISPLPLHKVLILRDMLADMHAKVFAAHESLALAHSLVSDICNLRFGPEVGVGRIKTDTNVVESWLSSIQAIATDLRQLQPLDDTPSSAFDCDARNIDSCIDPCSVDAVITSPPYPNEKDYSRIVRLESVLLGFIESRSDLQKMKRNLLRSNTRGVYSDDDDCSWVSDHAEVDKIADAIEARRIELGKQSGFERMYHRVTRLYFGGMARHFASLRKVLRPGARLAYVVGDQASYLRVMIRTGQILGDLAERAGYEVESLELFRTRQATATKQKLREEVLVLRWPGFDSTGQRS